jgi:hypothetical protein
VRPCGEPMYSGDHRKDLGLLATSFVLLVPIQQLLERECCLLVLNLVSSTLPCIRQPRPRLRVLDICGFVLVCTQAFIGFQAYERLVN